MIVKPNPDGTWGVYRGPRGKVAIAGPFATNAEAWRWIDQRNGSPKSKSEHRAEQLFGKRAGGQHQ